MYFNAKAFYVGDQMVKISNWYSDGDGHLAFNLKTRTETIPLFFGIEGDRPYEAYQKDFMLAVELVTKDLIFPTFYSILKSAADLCGFKTSYYLIEVLK